MKAKDFSPGLQFRELRWTGIGISFSSSLSGLDHLLYLGVIRHPHHLEETFKVDILLDNVATLHAWISEVKLGLASGSTYYKLVFDCCGGRQGDIKKLKIFKKLIISKPTF